MAEGDRTHAVDLINKLLVETLGNIMAPGTLTGGEGLLAVMAVPAIGAAVNVLHGDMSTTGFHQEGPWMAFFAAVSLCVCLMVEPRGHSGFVEYYVFNVMAIAAYVFINTDVLMPLKVVTLVAVNAACNMQPVCEYALFRICREFFKGVATEAGEFAYRLVL